MDKQLGQLKSVDLRTRWSNEAVDFTPWLAKEENISLLGEAIGLELEVERTEVPVGPYFADVLARDSNGNYVVIENQLGKTDHDHLGKALTYAAVLMAQTVVWIAPEFTEEHQKVLDWLNDSAKEIAFFGVQVELWSIDDSRPAVRFTVVSRPADIVRQASLSKLGELSEVRKTQLEWWTAFRNLIAERKLLTSPRAARPQYWYDVPLGRAGMHLSLTASPTDGRLGVRLYLRAANGGQRAFEQLSESREVIEKEIGLKLLWNPNTAAIDRTIGVYQDVDLGDRTQWSGYLDWMAGMMERFRKTFGPRVRDLDVSGPDEQEAS